MVVAAGVTSIVLCRGTVGTRNRRVELVVALLVTPTMGPLCGIRV
jgi:hypothetical protein